MTLIQLFSCMWQSYGRKEMMNSSQSTEQENYSHLENSLTEKEVQGYTARGPYKQ